ncbi:D-arabinitol dehydrogenase 1-like [Schistocerca americana]|uniref:D-arabinitol dehydrogenase 1-like n=1 Tax=Schistocerca americana TaxID=7009 RepID=UPI001F50274F|nr:D-arabinitol dehydrogenase 1-like [Schistocerca americana]XP_047107670.1 D-arabinitol dehydrogenase 1-like [Schistocerca piceifrons]
MPADVMDALQFDPKTLSLSLKRVPVPKVSHDTDVLIKVAFAGFCGSDLHMLKGQHPCIDTPFTLGHEFSGTVVDVGKAVHHVKAGDRVAVDPNRGCGACQFCSVGDYTHCVLPKKYSGVGCFRDGGWANYCVIPAVQVHKLTDDISLQQGTLVEPLSCICHGWDRIQPIRVASRILVMGAGIIGTLWTAMLHARGYQNVTVSEMVEHRRNVVAKLGTGCEVISPAELKQRMQKDPSYKFDLIVDCSGAIPALETALEMLNDGGKLLLFGMPPMEAEVKWKPFLIMMNEISVVGTHVNQWSFPEARAMMSVLGPKYIDYQKLGVKIFSLADYEQAIAEMKSGTISKAVFKISP